jgi:cell division septation protein DedD
MILYDNETDMRIILYLVLLFAFPIFAQEVNISKALWEVEAGNIVNAQTYLQEYKSTSPNDPSVIFLDGVLTQNGDDALKKYSFVYEKYPKSKYADACLFRIFSYYYSLGYYKKAESYLAKLKTEFPNSPYLKAADRTIPDEEQETNTITETKPEEKIIVPRNYKFTIQVGAFLNADNANKLNTQLNADGFASEIIAKEIGGSLFNIVNTGKFETEDEAAPILDTLTNKFSLKGRIVPLATEQ